jgi:hypothetical protein
MIRIGGYSPETAKLILATVNYLRQSGFVISPPGANPGMVHQVAPIYVRNDSGVAIPPFACMQVTGAVDSGGQNYVTVNKPVDVAGAAGWFLFNGIAEIEIDGKGIAHDGPLVRMLTNGTTISCGDRWRPTISQWYLTPATSGIFSAIGADDIETNVMRGLIMGFSECTNPLVDVYFTGSMLQKEFCDGTIEDVVDTDNECPTP